LGFDGTLSRPPRRCARARRASAARRRVWESQLFHRDRREAGGAAPAADRAAAARTEWYGARIPHRLVTVAGVSAGAMRSKSSAGVPRNRAESDTCSFSLTLPRGAPA